LECFFWPGVPYPQGIGEEIADKEVRGARKVKEAEEKSGVIGGRSSHPRKALRVNERSDVARLG
jgi:hypothetical protein